MSRVTPAHTEARRQAILDAAHRVFARRGIQAATMAEIAEEAGLSAGAIYRYFPGKDALAATCLHEEVELLAAEWQRMVIEADDPLDALYRIGAASFAETIAPGAGSVTILMLEEALTTARSDDPELRAHVRAKRDRIVASLAEALDAVIGHGSLPAALDSHQFAQALLAFWTGARVGRLIDPETDPPAQFEQLALLLRYASAGTRTEA